MLRHTTIEHARRTATTRWPRRPYALARQTGLARTQAGRLPVAPCGKAGENPGGRAPTP
jgi:hypothetical protein